MRLAIAIILAALTFHANAAVTKIWNNFATTNAPAAATNVVKSLATNVVANAALNGANVTAGTIPNTALNYVGATNGGPLVYSQLPYQSLLTNANGINLTNIPSSAITGGGDFVPRSGTNMTGGLTNNTRFDGNGAGLTNLPAANLSGSIADARLSANVPLKDAQNNFSGSNYFSQLGGGAATITTVSATTITGNASGITGTLSNMVIIPTVVALTASGTNVTVNSALGNHFSLTCATNIYFVQPSNLTPMQEMLIDVRMNGTGGWSVNFDTNYWKFPSGQVLTTTTNANAWSVISTVVGQFATNVAVIQSLNFQ